MSPSVDAFLSSLDQYEIAFPVRVRADGEKLDRAASHHRRRRRSSEEKPPDAVFYSSSQSALYSRTFVEFSGNY